MTNNSKILDIVIIGSGPAGYTAAIYASRANLNPILYTGPEPGGQLTTTTEVENFPGYPTGIEGPKMMEDLKAQAKRFGTDIRSGYITEVNFSKNGGNHILTINGKERVTTRSVIISTGASAKYLGLESEKRLMGGGVSACATCDGFFYKDQNVALVGGGDTAAEEALYLSKICNKIYMFIRKEEMRASKVMQNRVRNTTNIEAFYNIEVEEVLGNKVVEGVRVINNKDESKREFKVTGLFIAIGHKPNTDLFKGILDLDPQGYILTKGKSSKTNIDGVFAAGDVQDKDYRQAITAAGTGCMAALDAERYLNSKEY